MSINPTNVPKSITTESPYKHTNSQRGCCTDDATPAAFHERCHCSAPLSACKTACDEDRQCKGYVLKSSSGDCEIATVSECPATMSCSTVFVSFTILMSGDFFVGVEKGNSFQTRVSRQAEKHIPETSQNKKRVQSRSLSHRGSR